MKPKNPVIGKTCQSLMNENYKYHLSGDLDNYCLCSITGFACIGKITGDPDDQSSRFFSKAKCGIDYDKIKRCPLYGLSNEAFKSVLMDRYNEKIKQLKNEIETIK